MTTIYGYWRCSTGQQDEERQIRSLKDSGCEVIFGDKRIILVDGIPKGAVNRVPRMGEFKANLHLGAKADRTELTLKEKKICNTLKNTLKKNKLFLVGIDVINEKLTEINVTSPTGLVQISRLEKKNLAGIVWKSLLKKFAL